MMKHQIARWLQAGVCMGLLAFGGGLSFADSTPPLTDYNVKAIVDPLVQADQAGGIDRTEELQKLINSAGASGTVHIPAGCYKVSQVLYIKNGKQILGDGSTKTIIYRAAAPGRNPNGGIFKFAENKATEGLATRISGIAFVGIQDNTGEDGDRDFGIMLNDAKDFRVDHCYFGGFGLGGALIKGNSRGVVDHCGFVENFKSRIGGLGYGVAVYGAEKWEADPQLGTAEATVVEDCYFSNNRHSIASNAGAHYVFRHNLVQHGVVASGVDAHGPGYGSTHGTRCVEIYDNVIEEPEHKWCGIGIRGGEGVIFNNTIKDYRSPVYLFIEFDTKPEMRAHYPVVEQIQNLWIWDNKIVNGPEEPQVEKSAVDFIQKGRDFFTVAKPNYKPLTYPHPLTAR